MRSTTQRIEQLLASDEPGSAFDALVSDVPPDLMEQVRARLRAGAGHRASVLIALLRAVGEPGVAALRELLGANDGLTCQILGALSCAATPLRGEDLLPLLQQGSDDVVQAAIGATGFTGDSSLAPEVFRLWDSKHQLDVALCLGRLRARHYTPYLVELVGQPVDELHGQRWEFAAVALEAMADPTCRVHVLRFLKAAPPERVWSLVQILRRVSEVDQTGDWIRAEGEGDLEALRQSWLGEPPCVGAYAIEERAPRRAGFLLHGTGQLHLGFPPAVTAQSWPRWERALYWGDEVLFHANSTCPTCETYLRRAGATRPRIEADQVGATLAHLQVLDGPVLDRLAPVLRPLPSGRYDAVLADIPLERIDEGKRRDSWYAKRGSYRVPEDPEWSDPDDAPDPYVAWPETAHYQRPGLLETAPPTSLTVLPTQPLCDLDEATIAARREAIARGRCPGALALAWYEARSLAGSFPEAMVQCVLLDGHHTVEAYTREGRPARLLLLFPWAFSWPPDLRRALDLLA